jgi:uncharacterized integral membrane protein
VLYLILVLFLLVGGALTVITIQNLSSQQAHLLVFWWWTPDLPVGLFVLLAFLLGAFSLYIVSILSALRDYSEMSQLRKRVAILEQQAAANVQQTPPTTSGPTVPMPGMPSGPLEH